MIWNDIANQLADIFFQCMQIHVLDEQENEVPLISSSRKEIVDFIVGHFRKADGRQFNPSTIRSYLMTSRINKRPKEGRRINVKKLLDDIESSGE